MSGADVRGAGIERQVLDPLDRASEFLFCQIMALTFTCTLSATTTDDDAVLTVAIGALACNVTWGIVDAVITARSCPPGAERLSLGRWRSSAWWSRPQFQ